MPLFISMTFNPYVFLLDLQTTAVDFWKIYNIDFSNALDEIWVYPMYKCYFDGYTKPNSCLENYQYVR